jgi:HEAT repeat protein
MKKAVPYIILVAGLGVALVIALTVGVSPQPSLSDLSRDLESSDPAVRREAVWRLGDLGGDEAVALLIRAVGDPDRQVRLCAIQRLGEIGDTRAVPVLEDATNHRDLKTRYEAGDALQRIKGDYWERKSTDETKKGDGNSGS